MMTANGESNPELKNIIEAALLVAGQPLTIDRLLSLFPEDSRPAREEIQAVLEDLAADCTDRGIELKQIDRAWRYQTRERYAEWVSRLSEERPLRYSRALLETLAIIAYRQPVTRGEIEEIRGVAVSSEIIKTLAGREWIKQVGVRDVPGKPALYGTTRAFLEHFNLKSLGELPPLSELRDLTTIAAELNLELPVVAARTELQPDAEGGARDQDGAAVDQTETGDGTNETSDEDFDTQAAATEGDENRGEEAVGDEEAVDQEAPQRAG